MKFKIHLAIEILIFVLLYFVIGLKASLIITLFHFIPSIDYFMKRINFLAKFHRQLFHNIFVIIIASVLIIYFTNILIGLLSTLNLILHILMDLGGGGVMIFFPFSNYKLKIK